MVIGFDAHFCYLMQRYGRISAYELVVAKLDEDILAQVQEKQPGFIFLEVTHADSFVWDLFKQLKTKDDTRAIPIVVCSWQGVDLPDQPECADLYLRLPILYEHFKAALDQLSERNQERRE